VSVPFAGAVVLYVTVAVAVPLDVTVAGDPVTAALYAVPLTVTAAAATE
jgi:hypothetical protein